MSKRLNLKGRIFSTIIVKDFVNVKNTHAYWLVECTVCHATKEVSAANLMNGNSAGCNSCSKWKIPYKDRLLIAAAYQDGIKNNKIMEEFSISRSSIYKVIKDFGIKANRKKQ